MVANHGLDIIEENEKDQTDKKISMPKFTVELSEVRDSLHIKITHEKTGNITILTHQHRE